VVLEKVLLPHHGRLPLSSGAEKARAAMPPAAAKIGSAAQRGWRCPGDELAIAFEF
jgi:hypothetical protein